jgi:hypothetical protein
LHRRLVEVGQRGISVRLLGGTRAGEMRLTRLLRNPKVSAQAVFDAAGARTCTRVRGLHVLAIQDTTSLRDDGWGASLNAHPTIAACAETGALLGLAHGELLKHEGGGHEGGGAASGKRRRIGEKESRRWIDGAEAGARLLAGGAARVTVIADREGDFYEAFALRPAGVDLLIRAHHNRVGEDGTRLFEALKDMPETRFTLDLPAAPGRAARTARFALRFGAVSIKRPHKLPAGLPKSLDLTLIEAREVDPPAGQTAAHWRLLTTHAAADFPAARFILGLYRKRWLIEELFRVLKTRGFDIERVSIEEAPFETLAAAALVAAVSVLQLVQDRDGKGKRPLEDVFEACEQPALEAASSRLEGKTLRQKNPHPKGSLAYAAWVCARLGGWTGYYGKPGPLVMLRGLHQFRAIQLGWSLHNV